MLVLLLCTVCFAAGYMGGERRRHRRAPKPCGTCATQTTATSAAERSPRGGVVGGDTLPEEEALERASDVGSLPSGGGEDAAGDGSEAGSTVTTLEPRESDVVTVRRRDGDGDSAGSGGGVLGASGASSSGDAVSMALVQSLVAGQVRHTHRERERERESVELRC